MAKVRFVKVKLGWVGFGRDTFQNYILMYLKFKGFTPLHTATGQGNLDCMVELLKDRANIPAETKLQIDAQVVNLDCRRSTRVPLTNFKILSSK
jgi:hypothetical protein